MSWWDVLDPFTYLGDAAGKIVADAWTVAMLGIWNAGLWLLKLVLTIEDAFLTPDLSQNGPGGQVYPYTFWLAGALVVIMLMVQLATAVFRRDGQSLARAVIGAGQYVLVLSTWLVLAVAVLAGAGGLTKALMQALLGADSLAAWQPWTGFSTADISDGTIATVLGVMGLFLVFGAIGHGLVMLARGGALIVLTATAPIAAAGLVSETGRGWFWKTLRWFIAAAFSPLLMILVLGTGVRMTSGVALGLSNSLESAVGTAIPGVMLIAIGAFAPLALFKLLAFVDPGTSSGAALRAGMAAQGGIQAVMRGDAAAASGAASSTDQHGRSQGEASAEADTTGRFTSQAGGVMGALGPVGQAAAAGLGAMATLGAKGAALGADVTNQMGVGHNSYVPDFSATKNSSSGSAQGPRDDDNPDVNGSGAGATPEAPTGGGHAPTPPTMRTPQGPPTPGGTGPTATGAPGGAPGASGGGAGDGAAAGGAEAATIPIVPV